MKVILTGGTGLIGDRVSRYLAQQEYEIAALTRRAGQQSPHGLNLRFVRWDARTEGAWMSEIDGADAIVHLAGEGIFDARWTDDVKKRILQSRIETTRLLVQAIAKARNPPALFVSASAVGYYGDRGNEPTDETISAGKGFLADVCVQWEAEAAKARQYGVRIANPRIGIVLDKDGGALGRMIPVFRSFLGMALGSGQQWFPWIHADDVVRGLLYPLEQVRLEGAYNLASPNPVQMTEFCAQLAQSLHRPLWQWMNVPEFALRLGLGEAAQSLTQGQRIIPRVLNDAGFEFHYPMLAPALENILASP